MLLLFIMMMVVIIYERKHIMPRFERFKAARSAAKVSNKVSPLPKNKEPNRQRFGIICLHTGGDLACLASLCSLGDRFYYDVRVRVHVRNHVCVKGGASLASLRSARLAPVCK